MRPATRAKRILRAAAATLTLGVLATGTAHALTISGIDVIYDGVAQGSGYGLRGKLSGYAGTYAVYLNVCADVEWRADPCASRGRYGF